MLEYKMDKGGTVWVNPEYVAAIQEKGPDKAMIIMGVQGQVYVVKERVADVVDRVEGWLQE